MKASDIISQLKDLGDPEKIKGLSRFFKTGIGEYGEGDVFIGLTVPQTRSVALKFKNLELNEIEKLLHSEIHEQRLCALIILVEKSKKADQKLKKDLYDFYINNTKWINNWDLIDLTAEHIVGGYLLIHPKELHILNKFAKSDLVWERRIAVMATFQFIKNNKYEKTFEVAEILLQTNMILFKKL